MHWKKVDTVLNQGAPVERSLKTNDSNDHLISAQLTAQAETKSALAFSLSSSLEVK